MTALGQQWGNVVDLPRLNYTRKLANADQVMSTIRWEMNFHDPQNIADSIGVSLACINCIRLTMKLEKKQ